MSRIKLKFGAAMALLAIVMSCGGEQQTTSGEEDSPVLASVGNETITEADLQAALEAMQGTQRSRYETITGKQRLLDDLIRRKLIVLAAQDVGLDERPHVINRLSDFRERVLSQEFNNYLLEGLPQPTEEELKAYYDKFRDHFLIPARVNASWIKTATREEAEQARQRILNGEQFYKVAREMTIDDCSQKDGGLLGYFNPTGYVRCIGNRPEFSAKAFELEADDVGEVFEWGDGYAFIRINEKTTERYETYRKARDRIVARLSPRVTDSLVTTELDKLRDRFTVESHYDIAKELEGKSADDLMRLATDAGFPMDRVEYYRTLLEKYPNYERADEAQFMIGFVLSEEVKDLEAARVEYQRVIDEYPDSQIRESALYMLQNLGKDNVPAFEGTGGTR